MEELIVILSFISVASAIYYIGLASLQVQYVVLADGRRQERSLPIVMRAVLPFTALLPRLFRGPAAARHFAQIDQKLVSAGFEGVVTGREVALSRLWLTFFFLVLSLLAMHRVNLLVVLVVLYGFFYPDLWLRGAITARHRVIQRGLPFVLDLLTLCVEAGLDFMSALSKIIERRKTDALSEEVLRVFHSIKLGRTRRQALKEMSDRANFHDLTVVVNALIQADELGISLGTILRVQADQLRMKRFQRAETLANQAPTKLLLPLVLFIFPAVFIVLLGPVILQIFQRGL